MNKRKLWGYSSSVFSILMIVWVVISLPSLRGFEGEYAGDAKQVLGIAFLLISSVSMISGILLARTSAQTK